MQMNQACVQLMHAADNQLAYWLFDHFVIMSLALLTAVKGRDALNLMASIYVVKKGD